MKRFITDINYKAGLVALLHLAAETYGICDLKVHVSRKERFGEFYKMFVSVSWEPAHNIISICILLVTILSHGSESTAKATGACGLLVCQRRQTV